jgi:hypothetical protein
MGDKIAPKGALNNCYMIYEKSLKIDIFLGFIYQKSKPFELVINNIFLSLF